LLQQQLALRALNLEAGEGARRSASNFGPAVVGVFRPLLVTPVDFEQRYSRSEQALVLAHEDEHLRAGHTRVNAVALLVTSLCWFNPLIHWAAKLARDDQELACDAAVLQRFPKARGVYAEALLKTQVSSQALPLGCTWPSRSSSFFMERMTMLANKTPTRARRIAGIAAIATALLGTGLAAWAQKSPLPAFAGAVVSVDKDGHVLWDGKAADGKEALAAVAKVQGKSGSPHIRLTVDATTNYKTVVPVVEEAQKGGMKDITFLPSGTVFTTPTPPPPGLAPPKDPPAPIRVFVDFDGGVYWNGVWVNNAALDQNLKTAAAQAIQPELHIEPHYQSKFVRVVEVLDAAKKAGLTKTALVGGGAPFLAGMVK
jgi:biopolymer transport protein ExbD